MAYISIIFSYVLLCTINRMSLATCPKIITRSEWGARSAQTNPLKMNPATHVVIHHSETAACMNQAACSASVRSFQNTHMDVNKWADIGYNYLVGEDGNVYEGRGWGKTGAHAPNYNSKSIGICIIGTYASKLPNAAALKATKDLISCGVEQGKIKSDYLLVGHRQVRATDCPGDELYNEIKSWSHWTSQP